MAGSSVPVMYWAVHTTLCSAMRFRVVLLPYQAVISQSRCSQWYSCITFEDLMAHAKPFQHPEGEEALL